MITEVTSDNFENEVVLAAQPVVVDFYTQDCSPCRAMTPVLAELAAERKDSLKVVKVDVAENAHLVAQFRVTAMPTFILFQNGMPQRQVVGARSKKLFSAWIDGQN